MQTSAPLSRIRLIELVNNHCETFTKATRCHSPNYGRLRVYPYRGLEGLVGVMRQGYMLLATHPLWLGKVL
jgi:hypothetical protein